MTGLPLNPNCTLCPLHESSKHVCVPADIEHLKKKGDSVLFVGEIPNPGAGRGGQLLRDELQTAGIENYALTGAVKCLPPGGRPPTAEELKACRPYLEYEISEIKPKLVAALGSASSKSTLKISKITMDHGKILNLNGFKGMAIYSPSYILRDPNKIHDFRDDLKRLRDTLDGVATVKKVVRYAVVNKETIDQFFREFIAAPSFSFDTETGSLFQYLPPGHPDKYIACLGIGLENRSWIIPLNVRGSPFKDRKAQILIVKLLSQIAFDMRKEGIGQNGKFDNIWLLEEYGVRFPLTFDVMLAHYIIDENSPHDLEFLSRKYLGADAYDVDLATKQGKKSVPAMIEYNALDDGYTYQLKPIFEKILRKDPSQWNLFKQMIMPASKALTNVERRGLYVNLEKMEKTKEETAAALIKVLKELNKSAGKNINWSSPQQVAKLLYGKLKLKCSVKTGTGAQSTGEAALVELKGKHPVVDLLIKYRELEKFRGTYLEGWSELMNGPRLHFSYKIHGTVTGRWSSRLHQTPRDGTIRNIITAPPGWTFLQGDFSQAELNIAAQVSHDLEMMRCFREGIDVHWRTLIETIARGAAGEYVKPTIETACKISGKKNLSLGAALVWLEKAGHEKCIEIWKGWKEARKKAKGINFGFVYGMRERKFIEYAKLRYGFEPTPDEAHQIRNAYFSLYRGLTSWHEKQIKLVHLNEEVRNLIGRIRHLPTIRSPDKSLMAEAERQAINSPVQGIIGDLKAAAFIELDHKLDEDVVQVVGEVHDSILFNMRTEVLEAELSGKSDPVHLRQILTIMENPAIFTRLGVNLEIPVKCELEYGDWGKGTAIDRKIILR